VPERGPSIWRPRHGRPVGIRAGEAPRLEERADARSRCLDLLQRQQLAERDGQRPGHSALAERIADASEARQLLAVERLVLPRPEDAAQQQSIIDHSQALLEELQGSGDYEYIGTLKQTIRLAKARLEASQNARVPYEQASA